MALEGVCSDFGTTCPLTKSDDESAAAAVAVVAAVADIAAGKRSLGISRHPHVITKVALDSSRVSSVDD